MDMLHNLQQQSIPVNSSTYVKLLRRCIKTRDLAVGQQIHDHITRAELPPNNIVINNLIHMYTKCGSLVDARKVFDKHLKKDVVSWNVMIGGYAQHGHIEEAFTLFRQMRQEGFAPDQVTYMSILNACASPAALERGKEVHAHICDNGLQCNVRIGTALVNMYARCGSIRSAQVVFDEIGMRDVISWTAMIVGYAKHGHCEEAFDVFRQMLRVGLKPDHITYTSILNACACATALERGKEVHAHIIDTGFQSHVCVGNALVNMYAKCGSIRKARLVFNEMGKRDIISWTALIGGYSQHGDYQEAFEVFRQMQQVGLMPNHFTYMSILNACACPAALERGKEVHAHFINSGLLFDVRLGTALINMYARCGSIRNAQVVFDEIGKQDVVSWTAMIVGYAQHGHCEEAFEIFRQMLQCGIKPNQITYMSILKSFACPTALEPGMEVHAHIIDAGFQSHVCVGNALVNMYAKCGSISKARQVFDEMGKRDIISWTALIEGYVQHGHCEEAFEVFRQMQQVGLKPDQITYISILKACACSTALERGKEVHAHIIDAGFQSDVPVGNALINMYAKCGSISEAQLVFDKMGKRDTISWTTMIVGLALYGCGQDALQNV